MNSNFIMEAVEACNTYHTMYTKIKNKNPFNKDSSSCVMYGPCISHNNSLKCEKQIMSIGEMWKKNDTMNKDWGKNLRSPFSAYAKSTSNLSWWLIFENCVRHWVTNSNLHMVTGLTILLSVRLYLCMVYYASPFKWMRVVHNQLKWEGIVLCQLRRYWSV